MDSQRAAGQGEAKAQQTPQPQAPPMAPGGARRAPCGFWSALSHRLGQPRAANLLHLAPELALRSELILEIPPVTVYVRMSGGRGRKPKAAATAPQPSAAAASSGAALG